MTDPHDLEDLAHEMDDLQRRITELRQAASLPGADLAALLDAALVELDLIRGAAAELGREPPEPRATRPDPGDLERRTLRAVFQDAPLPLFLLEHDGVVRRINREAGGLLGTAPGYATGKPFVIFVDLPARAALRSQLAGIVRTGRRRKTRTRLVARSGTVEADLLLSLAHVPGEPDPLVIVAAGPTAVSATLATESAAAAPSEQSDHVVSTLVRRLDVLARATGLLLEDRSFNESVSIQRCARLLAEEIADWVIVDVEREGRLIRHVVATTAAGEAAAHVARQVEDLDPGPDTLPDQVFRSGHAVLLPYVSSSDLLGATPTGVPVLALLRTASVMCVPVGDADRRYGVLTLVATTERGSFELLDLGLVEHLGRHLGLVIRTTRAYRRRSEVADALQASLLPRRLPDVPGVELAASYMSATRGVEVGGDFYDVFEASGGWGAVLGDVCGKGEEAAAVTATARHGIRLLAHWNPKPDRVLAQMNEVLVTDHERYVTAVMVYLEIAEHGVRVTLASAGHPPALVVRADGAVRTMSGGGLPLGLFDDAEPSLESFDLGVGDTLVLYSDGVLDLADDAGEPFGSERLAETLTGAASMPPAELVATLGAALAGFCDGEFRDDVSVLAIRASGRQDGLV